MSNERRSSTGKRVAAFALSGLLALSGMPVVPALADEANDAIVEASEPEQKVGEETETIVEAPAQAENDNEVIAEEAEEAASSSKAAVLSAQGEPALEAQDDGTVEVPSYIDTQWDEDAKEVTPRTKARKTAWLLRPT